MITNPAREFDPVIGAGFFKFGNISSPLANRTLRVCIISSMSAMAHPVCALSALSSNELPVTEAEGLFGLPGRHQGRAVGWKKVMSLALMRTP